MRQLGEQGIEIIDGQKHMVKAVAPIELCQGCCVNCNQGGCCWKGFDDCQMGSFFIIKDLGPVNEDGLLPCPFCEEYPKQISNGVEYILDEEIPIFYVEHRCKTIQATEFCYTEQECIDAWNRRA